MEMTIPSPEFVPANVNSDFEKQLIAHLQPIRQHVLATNLYHLFNTGLYDILLAGDSSIAQLAEAKAFDPQRLRGFLDYLYNEAIIELRDDDSVSLTAKGRAYEPFRPWYIMLIGGYADTFLQVGKKLSLNSDWASRDVAKVGLGSCGISYYDAIPLTAALMAEMPHPCKKLLDLGCGNALYLTEFCKAFPDIEAWGVEPDAGGCEEARTLIDQAGMNERIKITCAPGVDFLHSDVGDYQPDVLVFGFILQEIIAQDGEEAMVQILGDIFSKFPDLYLIVIEVDNQVRNPHNMAHGLALAYYNAYYLLHQFTQQRLEPPAFWEAIFERSGVVVVSKKTTLPQVDSTQLAVGYLLKKRGE